MDDLSARQNVRNHLLWGREGGFAEQTDSFLAAANTAMDCDAGNLDNDGAHDPVVLESTPGKMVVRARVFLSAGGGGFAMPAEPMLVSAEEPGIGDGILASDLDDDGDLDLLLLMGGVEWEQREACGGVRLYRNESRGSHWLNVGLDPGPHRWAYGARVEVTCGARTQSRQYWPHQVSGSAFADPIHFGVGGATRVDRITVYWPSGARTALTYAAVDQQLVLRQP